MPIKKIIVFLFTLLISKYVFSSEGSGGEVLEYCPAIGIAPRTGNGTAEQFSKSGKFSLDEDEILLFDYGEAYNHLGKYKNPYFISNYANLLYKDYLVSKCADKVVMGKFLKQADWFLENADRQDGVASYRYPFSQPAFDLKPGWISGIGQSRIAGVLQRAFAITQKDEYRQIAKESMEVYRIPPVNGGVATTESDATWFEEAANKNGQSYKILNGHITALAGIFDYYLITKEEQWKQLYECGINAVRRDIAKFDAGFTSYYSLSSPVIRQFAARADYNALHVHQLLWLFEETKDSFFLEWASRFQAYEMNSDRYSAKGSVDPVKHGPEQAAGFYGNHYWSHSSFPTWIQVDVGEPTYFKGIAIHSNSDKAALRDFSISARVGDNWKVIDVFKDNVDIRRMIEFEYPILADAFKVDIESDNGNKNVALQAVMPIRSQPKFGPITNECNYRTQVNGMTGAANYNFDLALSGDSRSMQVFCLGWIILPLEKANKLIIEAHALKNNKLMQVDFSDDLHVWTHKKEVAMMSTLTDLPATEFIRISFDNDVKEIKSIRLVT